jgi:succinyl-CoA synthetase beta subunit
VQLVVKSQILAGGRGLGTFTSGLKGGVHIVKTDQVEDIAGNSSIPVFISMPFNIRSLSINNY